MFGPCCCMQHAQHGLCGWEPMLPLPARLACVPVPPSTIPLFPLPPHVSPHLLLLLSIPHLEHLTQQDCRISSRHIGRRYACGCDAMRCDGMPCDVMRCDEIRGCVRSDARYTIRCEMRCRCMPLYTCDRLCQVLVIVCTRSPMNVPRVYCLLPIDHYSHSNWIC